MSIIGRILVLTDMLETIFSVSMLAVQSTITIVVWVSMLAVKITDGVLLLSVLCEKNRDSDLLL